MDDALNGALRLRSRPYTPTDKPHVEGAFGLFAQKIPLMEVTATTLEELAGEIAVLVVTTWARTLTWAADITYVRTWTGWLYLGVVIDLFSRRVVGWAIADHMRTELVLTALDRAIRDRRPAPGLVHHPDRGGNRRFYRLLLQPPAAPFDARLVSPTGYEVITAKRQKAA
ncbi:MAG: transposase InsO family protein [Myxococcota bacterium]